MNKKDYAYIVIILVIIVGAVMLSKPRETVAPGTLEQQGTTDNSGQSAVPTNPTGSTGTVVSKPAATAYYSSSVQPTMLPIYPTVISSTTVIQVTSPSSNTAIQSPFKVTGLARGTWYFEGSFPVILIDSKNKILAQGQAIAQNNWMTTELVPFSATLSFPRQTTGSKGFLILKKDNPSGLTKNDAAVEMQVAFQ